MTVLQYLLEMGKEEVDLLLQQLQLQLVVFLGLTLVWIQIWILSWLLLLESQWKKRGLDKKRLQKGLQKKHLDRIKEGNNQAPKKPLWEKVTMLQAQKLIREMT